MSWFKKKVIEIKYVYMGIRQSFNFFDDIDRFIELDRFFKTSNKVYTENELILISKTLSDNNKGIDVLKCFCWLSESEYQNEIKDSNLILTSEIVKIVKSIKINNEFFDFIFFNSFEEKNNLLLLLENRIVENKSCINNKILDNNDLLNLLYKPIESYNLPIMKLFIVEWGIYTVSKFSGKDYISVNYKSDFSNQNFDLKNSFTLLNLSLLNLKRKVFYNYSDISEEEIVISNIFDMTEDLNLGNGIGYDFFESLLVLITFYFDLDNQKTIRFINKIDINWSEISNNVVSKGFRLIGDLFLKVNDSRSSLLWYKKGLVLNPKLGVIKLIDSLEKKSL